MWVCTHTHTRAFSHKGGGVNVQWLIPCEHAGDGEWMNSYMLAIEYPVSGLATYCTALPDV